MTMARRNKIARDHDGRPLVLPRLGTTERAALKLAGDPGFGVRREDGRCSGCGGSGFSYNANHVRGYVCMECGTIKPERKN